MAALDELTRELALDLRRRAAVRVQRHLRGQAALLSGEDSGLCNVWEEFCVQVQEEESALWGEYLQTVNQFIEAALESVNSLSLRAMWFQTDAGDEWLTRQALDSELAPVSLPDVVAWTFDEVWRLAAEYRHPHVRGFLRRVRDGN